MIVMTDANDLEVGMMIRNIGLEVATELIRTDGGVRKVKN